MTKHSKTFCQMKHRYRAKNMGQRIGLVHQLVLNKVYLLFGSNKIPFNCFLKKLFHFENIKREEFLIDHLIEIIEEKNGLNH